jgi:hypothetical protein
MPEMRSSDNDGMRPTTEPPQISPERLADLGRLGRCDHRPATANLADHDARRGGRCATQTNRLTVYGIHRLAPLNGTFWRIVFCRLGQRRLAHRVRRKFATGQPEGRGCSRAILFLSGKPMAVHHRRAWVKRQAPLARRLIPNAVSLKISHALKQGSELTCNDCAKWGSVAGKNPIAEASEASTTKRFSRTPLLARPYHDFHGRSYYPVHCR